MGDPLPASPSAKATPRPDARRESSLRRPAREFVDYSVLSLIRNPCRRRCAKLAPLAVINIAALTGSGTSAINPLDDANESREAKSVCATDVWLAPLLKFAA